MNHCYPIIELKEQYCSDELLEIVSCLLTILENKGVKFVYGKGKRKNEIQRLFDLFDEFQNKMSEYNKHLEIIGKNRNSYSKTDKDATFMRMKEDYMMNV